MWKNTTKRDHAQKFPWNQLFSTHIHYVVKMLIWRKIWWIFRKNSDDRVFDDFFHTEPSHQKNISSNQRFSNFLLNKTVVFTKFLPKMREMREYFRGFHCSMCKTEKFCLTPPPKNISSNCDSLVISLVKTLFSRIFCQKSVRVNFRNFCTVHWNLLSRFATKISWKQRSYRIMS